MASCTTLNSKGIVWVSVGIHASKNIWEKKKTNLQIGEVACFKFNFFFNFFPSPKHWKYFSKELLICQLPLDSSDQEQRVFAPFPTLSLA